MRIACPACQAEYDVPDSMLSGRRVVRCARCGEEWRPDPVEPAGESLPATIPAETGHPLEPEPAPNVAPEPLAPSLFLSPREPLTAPPPPAPRRPGAFLLAGWVITLVILAALLYGGYAWRDPLMAAWPPSTRLYAALGLRH